MDLRPLLIVVVSMLLFGGVLYSAIRWRERPYGPYLTLAAFASGALAFIALMMPVVIEPRDAFRRTQCTNNLKQIALALWSYEADQGAFPPAYVADSQGRPMHSWRVLLLPYIEQQGLHKQYRFDEPWDGPHNRKLHDAIVALYHCPSEDDEVTQKTAASYLAVVGRETGWNLDRPMKPGEIRDGCSHTIALVEVRGSGIHWMEPRDLYLGQMAPTVNARLGQGPSSCHEGVHAVHAAFFDGSIHMLSDKLTAEQLRALLTRDGGEPFEEE